MDFKAFSLKLNNVIAELHILPSTPWSLAYDEAQKTLTGQDATGTMIFSFKNAVRVSDVPQYDVCINNREYLLYVDKEILYMREK